MAIKPILFNTEMVRAILDGRKSCTRRIIKPQPQGYFEVSEEPLYIYDTDGKQGKITPPYQPGDILYVRETWRVGAWDIFNQMIAFDYKDGTCGELTYIHDRELFDRLVNQSRNDARQAKCEYNGADFVWEKGKSPCRWHPSIHMPKEAARIWLKVTDVRVERLNEINEDGALREGAQGIRCDHVALGEHGCTDCMNTGWLEPPQVEFMQIWNSTIKKSDLDRYGWDANPWVWVIEFERCEKPEGV